MPIKNLISQRFGKLKVFKLADPPSKNESAMWICQCECGEYREVSAKALKRGETYACRKCTKVIHGEKISRAATEKFNARKVALKNGNTFYEGSPCRKGHGTKRRASNGSCGVCEDAKQKKRSI